MTTSSDTIGFQFIWLLFTDYNHQSIRKNDYANMAVNFIWFYANTIAIS